MSETKELQIKLFSVVFSYVVSTILSKSKKAKNIYGQIQFFNK